MPRFDCTVLHDDAILCEAMIDVRKTPEGWDGVILVTTPPEAIQEPGTYTFRLADGSDHAASIKSVRSGGGASPSSARAAQARAKRGSRRRRGDDCAAVR